MQSDPHHGGHLPSPSPHIQDRPAGRGEAYEVTPGHANHADTSPLPPTSPNLTTAFHRPQHTPDHNDDMTGIPSLRRRHTQPHGEVIRIAIATPFSDAQRRKERDLSVNTNMAQLKDVIAQDDEGAWERNGMRLVWQGRIVRDEEILKDVVGRSEPGQVHTFHLVARRKAGAASLPSRPEPISTASAPVPPASIDPVQPTPTASFSRNTQALSDSVHFVLFLVRHHLCHLLNATPLAWDDAIPPPVVSQDVAREAVMSVVQLHAAERSEREEGWEGWEKAFVQPADVPDVQWESATRNELESEIKSLWSERVGRAWKDGEAGEEVSVDFDERTYKLHLPPLGLMSPKQIVHLCLYLRLTSLLPLLNNLLAITTAPRPQFIPFPFTSPPSTLPSVRVRQYGFRFRFTPEAIWNVLFGAVKVGAMLWMLTRGMKWSDFKMWIIAGGLIGYWVGDAIGQLRLNIIWNNGNRPVGPDGQVQAGFPPLHGGDQALNPQAPAQAGADAPRYAPGEAAPADALRDTPRQPPQSGNLITRMIPLIHLDEDSIQLHLARERPRSRPFRLVTQLLLPVALWFITLIPEWESLRARAIRRRERAMRVWVGELTTAREAENDAQRTDRGEEESSPDVTPEADATRPPADPVFPPGLSDKARKYYERVVARGEGIDWEEEREAQRAMGVAEEDDAADGEMRMRM